MRIPLCDLERRYAESKSEYDAAVRRFLDAQNFTLGPEGEAFEREFAAYLGVRHVVGVANGTDAIELVLRAMGIGPGDEVVTVAHTFIASVSAIRLADATPVLVDVDPSTHTMDPSSLERAITPRTRAILPVHLYGRPADMTRIREIADPKNIPVIEDAAQAHGARSRGRRVGTLGKAACFSFYPTKNLGAMGDGGAVATDDDDLAARLRALRHHGQRERNQHDVLGRNSRLDEIQAAILRVGLQRLDANNARRRKIASAYRDLIGGAVGIPAPEGKDEHVYHLFVVGSDRREDLRSTLHAAGVGTGIHYPVPVHKQPSWNGPPLRLPVTERLAARILSIPMFPELRIDEVEDISAILRKHEQE